MAHGGPNLDKERCAYEYMWRCDKSKR